MPRIAVNGVHLYYEIHGSGDYLLQVGGAVSGHEGYAAVTAAMAEHFTVIDFDHRGYGLSDRPTQKYDFDGWADDMAGLLDALKIERTHVHGGSMGSSLAVRYAAKYPARVHGLVLSGCTAKSDYMAKAQYEVWKALARTFGTGSRELASMLSTNAVSRAYLDGPSGGEAFVRSFQEIAARNVDVDVFCAACDALSSVDVTDDLAKVCAPTLVIVGDEDNLTPAVQGVTGVGGQQIFQRLANAPFKEYVVLQGCGHGNLVERPKESNDAVISFLKRLSAASGT
jgi:pimeloyl-ACP methyl ester carboxylesterase